MPAEASARRRLGEMGIRTLVASQNWASAHIRAVISRRRLSEMGIRTLAGSQNWESARIRAIISYKDIVLCETNAARFEADVEQPFRYL